VNTRLTAGTSDDQPLTFTGDDIYGFDSKARRKIDPDNSLWIGFRSFLGNPIDEYVLIVRTLFKLVD